jgi:broad specificity phosphatase PhoE
MKAYVIFLMTTIALFVPLIAPCQEQNNETTTLIIVRHAEEDRSKEEIPLTQGGSQRAKELARILENVKIDAVYSTPTDRTRGTARPMAEARGLSTNPYSYANYDELQPFLDSILKKHRGKTVLISGHSDDVPAMLTMLRKEWDGGKDVMLIPKPVYDNLYIVFVPAAGSVTVLNLKYGKPTP